MLDLYAKPGYKMKLRDRIKWWFRRRKYARQRARWGFSEYDVWSMNAYLSELLCDMFAYWAKHHNSHPYEVSEEEWQQTLINISECFAQYTREFPTPAYDAFHEAVVRRKIEGGIEIEAPDDLLQAWRDEEKEHYEYRMKKLKEGFDLLFKYYPNLWD
jgi:hypothetical protein